MEISSSLFEDGKFLAALNILMAKYTFNQLNDDQRYEVEEIAIKLVEEAGMHGIEYFAMSEELQFGLIAASMNRLNINPAIPGENWELLGNPFSEDAQDEEFFEKAHDYIKEKYGIEIYGDEDAEESSELVEIEKNV